MLFAGWAGAAISIGVLLLILLAFQVDVIVRFACLVAYPVFGYSVGILDAASRTIRSGI